MPTLDTIPTPEQPNVSEKALELLNVLKDILENEPEKLSPAVTAAWNQEKGSGWPMQALITYLAPTGKYTDVVDELKKYLAENEPAKEVKAENETEVPENTSTETGGANSAAETESEPAQEISTTPTQQELDALKKQLESGGTPKKETVLETIIIGDHELPTKSSELLPEEIQSAINKISKNNEKITDSNSWVLDGTFKHTDGTLLLYVKDTNGQNYQVNPETLNRILQERPQMKKNGNDLESVATPFGELVAGKTVTLADSELHAGLTTALMQRNKIIAPEMTYKIIGIFESAEGDATLVDVVIPARPEAGRVTDEKITISLGEMEQEAIPQTISVDGFTIAKHTKLPSRLRKAINRIGKKRFKKPVTSWEVVNMFKAKDTGDILLDLQGPNGEEYQVDPELLEKVTVEHRLDRVKQNTKLTEKKQQALDDFLESHFRFPEGGFQMDPEPKEEKPEKEPKPKKSDKKTKVGKDNTTPSNNKPIKNTDKVPNTDKADKLDKTPKKPESISTSEPELKLNADNNIVSEETKAETPIDTENNTKPDTDIEPETEPKLEHIYMNSVLKNELSRILGDAVSLDIHTSGENVLVTMENQDEQYDTTVHINLANHDGVLSLDPDKTKVELIKKEKGGILSRSKTTEITDTTVLDTYKTHYIDSLQKALAKAMIDKGYDPKNHFFKINKGQLTIYSK